MRLLLAALALLLLPQSARAHDVEITSVARIFIDETGARQYALSVLDARLPPLEDPAAVLPAGCRPLTDGAAEIRSESGFVFECEEQLGFDDVITLPIALAGVVVVFRQSEGSIASAYFASEGGVVPVRLADLRPAAGSVFRLGIRYFSLGVEHILFGIDHLLFVLALLLVVPGFRLLVGTITAFTVAHSLTLGAAVLGWVPVSAGPVEATIALSIILVARELAMRRNGQPNLLHDKPWVVAFAFGLLHGFGFAGALGEIGLQSSDVPLALFFFNVGVEAGQLTFVSLMLVLYWGIRGGLEPHLPRLKLAAGYALGTMATIWFLGRLPDVWG